MMTFALMLAAMSTGVEMFFVIQFEPVRKFFSAHKKFGLFFSFFLSYAIGIVFGAEGLIAMSAAIFSTVFSLIIYESGILALATVEKRAELGIKYHKALDTFIGTVRFWGRVISAPYRFLRSVQRRWMVAASAASRIKSRAKRGLRMG